MSISLGAMFPAFSLSSTILSTARLSSSSRNRLLSGFETVAGELSRQARSLGSGV